MAIGLSNARLAIPRVNQNPKPPTLKQGLANRIVAKPGAIAQAKPVATSTSQPTNTVATTPGSTSAAAAAPVAAPTPAPASSDPFAVPTYTPTAGTPDPRDATYWSNLAKLRFTDSTEFAKIGAEQTSADSDYNSALQQAIQNRATQERQLGESAIKSNLSASGWLDRSQGEQVRNYTQERSNASLTKEQQDAARTAARQALVEGYGVDSAAELGAAAARSAEGQAKEAESGAPESTPPPNGVGGANTNTGAPGGSYGRFQFYPGVNQLPSNQGPGSGQLGKSQKVKPVKTALANRKKAK